MLLCSQCMTETLKDIYDTDYQQQEKRFIRAVKKKDLLDVGFISVLCVKIFGLLTCSFFKSLFTKYI